MKKILLITLAIFASNCLKAQEMAYKPLSEFKGDTSAFVLYNFMDRALAYKGKTFADVITDLKVPVKSFAYTFNGDDLKAIYLSPYPTIFPKKGDISNIYIEWENPIIKEDIFKLVLAKDGWNEQIYNHYKDKKIKYIYVDIPENSIYYTKYGMKLKSNNENFYESKVFFDENGEFTVRYKMKSPSVNKDTK